MGKSVAARVALDPHFILEDCGGIPVRSIPFSPPPQGTHTRLMFATYPMECEASNDSSWLHKWSSTQAIVSATSKTFLQTIKSLFQSTDGPEWTTNTLHSKLCGTPNQGR